jgi:hypothetical protein
MSLNHTCRVIGYLPRSAPSCASSYSGAGICTEGGRQWQDNLCRRASDERQPDYDVVRTRHRSAS